MRNNKGFTMIELLVVAGIIVIMSAVFVVNFRRGESGSRLQRSAQLIVQSIRRAQNMALSSTEFQGDIPYAYGVYFEKQSPNSYILFADTNDNKKYDGSDELSEDIDLERGIQIESLSAEPKLHIAFEPPYSFVEFNPTATTATITIKKENGTCPQDCRYIKINDKGWMGIQNNP